MQKYMLYILYLSSRFENTEERLQVNVKNHTWKKTEKEAERQCCGVAYTIGLIILI